MKNIYGILPSKNMVVSEYHMVHELICVKALSYSIFLNAYIELMKNILGMITHETINMLICGNWWRKKEWVLYILLCIQVLFLL